jgi:hypothetical protein
MTWYDNMDKYINIRNGIKIETKSDLKKMAIKTVEENEKLK